MELMGAGTWEGGEGFLGPYLIFLRIPVSEQV